MASSNRPPLQSAKLALRNGLLRSKPDSVLDKNGYVSVAVQNLIDGVDLSSFEADLRQGSGNELVGKFRAAHSSSALAVNAFAPFKADLASLKLPGGDSFSSLQFERKCPHGVRGTSGFSAPPNLDVVVEGKSVVAIESKCIEFLTRKSAKFLSAYETQIQDERRGSPWFKEMLRLIQNPRAYRWLDAAQLIKHAYGLIHTFPGQPVTLLYLYWEPSNPGDYPLFQEHRDEIARFADSIAGSGPEFVAMSYPELWSHWELQSEPDWLAGHVSRLRERYDVAV